MHALPRFDLALEEQLGRLGLRLPGIVHGGRKAGGDTTEAPAGANYNRTNTAERSPVQRKHNTDTHARTHTTKSQRLFLRALFWRSWNSGRRCVRQCMSTCAEGCVQGADTGRRAPACAQTHQQERLDSTARHCTPLVSGQPPLAAPSASAPPNSRKPPQNASDGTETPSHHRMTVQKMVPPHPRHVGRQRSAAAAAQGGRPAPNGRRGGRQTAERLRGWRRKGAAAARKGGKHATDGTGKERTPAFDGMSLH